MLYVVKVLKCTKCGHFFDPAWKDNIFYRIFNKCQQCHSKNSFVTIKKIKFGKQCPNCNHIIPTKYLPLGKSLLLCQGCGAKVYFDKMFSLSEFKEAIVILLIIGLFIIINIVLYYTLGIIIIPGMRVWGIF